MGLVRPKASAFSSTQPAPPFLLCVVTAVDVLLFAINFTGADGKPIEKFSSEGNGEACDAITVSGKPTSSGFRTSDMHLMPDPLYRLSLDGAIVSDIVSTSSGRIFLTARDCCLYEIDYQVGAN